MKLAMSNIAWLPDEADECLGLLHDAGAKGLEIAPGLTFPHETDPFNPSPSAVSALFASLEAHELQLVSMQSLLFGVQNARLFGTPSERDAFEEGLLRAIHLAGILGIPNLVMGSPGNRAIPEGMARKDAEAVACATFRRLGDMAQKAGTCLALEPNPAAYGTNFLTTLTEAVDFAALVDHPGVTVNFDIGALHMNDEFERGCELYDYGRNVISHVHISEPNLAPAPKAPAALATLALHIVNSGYEGWFSIEMRQAGEAGIAEVKNSLARAASSLRSANA